LNLSEEEVLSFDNGRISRDSQPDEHILLKEAIAYFNQLFGKTPTARAVYQPTNTSAPDPKSGYGNYCPTYSFGAQAAEVEVDRKTGKVRVLNIAAAHDLGRSINPLLVEGQIEGGVAMGIGYALFEGTKLSEGEILNKNFGVYKIVNSTEMPNVSSILIETFDPQGPFNAKGIGELSAIPTAPAIANAVYNALGIRLKDLPITPQEVLEEIEKKSD
jgi:putative selenate reductase molybdopterin-binding subunit